MADEQSMDDFLKDLNKVDGLCEVCGEPATVRVMDVQEISPVPDGENKKVVWNAQVVQPHLFCDAHKRQPTVTVLTDEELQRIMDGGSK